MSELVCVFGRESEALELKRGVFGDQADVTGQLKMHSQAPERAGTTATHLGDKTDYA